MLRYTERGERMIVGMMEAESTMQFTREDVRQSIKRVNVYGLQLRSQAFKK
jgi:hypothetical protein